MQLGSHVCNLGETISQGADVTEAALNFTDFNE